MSNEKIRPYQQQNTELRDEIKILLIKKQTWFEISIASWLTTLTIAMFYTVEKLS